MKHLPLIGTREGKRVLRWPVLLMRCAVYVVIVGVVVYAVTWLSDWIFHQDAHRDLIRLITIPLFLAVLFGVHDLRQELKMPSKDLPELDRRRGSKVE